MSRIAWELAGLYANEGAGGLERPIGDRSWLVPVEVTLDGPDLVADFGPPGTNRTLADSGSGMLSEFIRLRDGDGGRIARFARKWGALLLCPCGFGPGRNDHSSCKREPDVLPQSHVESLDHWRSYASAATAVLDVASSLHNGELGGPSAWANIYPFLWPNFVHGSATSHVVPLEGGGEIELGLPDHPAFTHEVRVGIEQVNLSLAVNGWLEDGAVTLELRWDSLGAQVALAPAGLFGALGIQLMLAVCRADGVAHCSECRRPYIPVRKPSKSRNNYCDSCKPAASRNSSRTFREQEAAKSAGLSDGPSSGAG